MFKFKSVIARNPFRHWTRTSRQHSQHPVRDGIRRALRRGKAAKS